MSGGVGPVPEGRRGSDAPPEQRFPLTLGQRWIAASRERPGRGVPLQRVYRLHGNLDTRRLLRSLTKLVKANEALRLRLYGSDGRWEQSFPDRDLVVDAVVPTGGTESQRFLWALGYISQAAAEPLDLELNGPFSVQLVRLGDSTHLLALTIDHLAVDGIGFDLIEDRLAESPGSGDHVASGRFVDYLEQHASNREESERALKYWLDLLRPLPNCPPKGERVRGSRAAPTWRGAEVMQVIDACRERHWSPFMALIAAQAILMSRLSGTLDAVLSVPFSNRITDEEGNLVANLATLGYVPVRLAADERLGDYRERVRRLVVESMGHRNVDMWELGRALARAAEHEGRTLNFVTGCSFIVDAAPPGRKDVAGLVAERLEIEDVLPFALPPGTLLVSCRQGLGEFDLELLWDPGTWPLGDGSELLDAFHWVTCAEDSVLIGEYVGS